MELIEIKRIRDAYAGTTFIFPLSRYIVSELHNWRLGFKNFSRKKFSFIGAPKTYVPSENLLRNFDDYFLNVAMHRNVLQHYGEYIFGEHKAANVKASEFKRIGANIHVMNGGSCATFMSNYIGELFCSSGRDGMIHEVYIGEQFEDMVKAMLSLFCSEISSNKEVFEIIPVFDMNRTEFEKIVRAQFQSLGT